MADTPPLFIQRRVVEFHETDAAGIVHFSNVFLWMESAEMAFLRQRKIPILSLSKTGGRGWPRVSVNAQFKSPLRFEDQIETRLWLGPVGVSSVCYRFEIWRMSGPGQPTLAATGEMTTVYVTCSMPGGKLEPTRLPPALRRKLK